MMGQKNDWLKAFTRPHLWCIIYVEVLAMATKTVDIADTQASLSDLVSLVNTGVEIVLTKNSTPVACLVPMGSPPGARVPGLHPGAILASDDFDQPLPDEFWAGEA